MEASEINATQCRKEPRRVGVVKNARTDTPVYRAVAQPHTRGASLLIEDALRAAAGARALKPAGAFRAACAETSYGCSVALRCFREPKKRVRARPPRPHSPPVSSPALTVCVGPLDESLMSPGTLLSTAEDAAPRLKPTPSPSGSTPRAWRSRRPLERASRSGAEACGTPVVAQPYRLRP